MTVLILSISTIRIFQGWVPPTTFCVDAHEVLQQNAKASQNAEGKETSRQMVMVLRTTNLELPHSLPSLLAVMIGSLFLAAWSQTENLPSRLFRKKSGLLGASPFTSAWSHRQKCFLLPWAFWALSSCIFHWLCLTDHLVRDVSPTTQDMFSLFSFCGARARIQGLGWAR